MCQRTRKNLFKDMRWNDLPQLLRVRTVGEERFIK